VRQLPAASLSVSLARSFEDRSSPRQSVPAAGSTPTLSTQQGLVHCAGARRYLAYLAAEESRPRRYVECPPSRYRESCGTYREDGTCAKGNSMVLSPSEQSGQETLRTMSQQVVPRRPWTASTVLVTCSVLLSQPLSSSLPFSQTILIWYSRPWLCAMFPP